MNEHDDELKTSQSFNSKRIYTNDYSEEEVMLYALETIPKVRVLFQADQRVWGDNDQSIPHVLTEREIMEWVNKI